MIAEREPNLWLAKEEMSLQVLPSNDHSQHVDHQDGYIKENNQPVKDDVVLTSPFLLCR